MQLTPRKPGKPSRAVLPRKLKAPRIRLLLAGIAVVVLLDSSCVSSAKKEYTNEEVRVLLRQLPGISSVTSRRRLANVTVLNPRTRRRSSHSSGLPPPLPRRCSAAPQPLSKPRSFEALRLALSDEEIYKKLKSSRRTSLQPDDPWSLGRSFTPQDYARFKAHDLWIKETQEFILFEQWKRRRIEVLLQAPQVPTVDYNKIKVTLPSLEGSPTYFLNKIDGKPGWEALIIPESNTSLRVEPVGTPGQYTFWRILRITPKSDEIVDLFLYTPNIRIARPTKCLPILGLVHQSTHNWGPGAAAPRQPSRPPPPAYSPYSRPHPQPHAFNAQAGQQQVQQQAAAAQQAWNLRIQQQRLQSTFPFPRGHKFPKRKRRSWWQRTFGRYMYRY